MQSSSWFWRLLSKCQNHEEDYANFCGLLRKAELSIDTLQRLHVSTFSNYCNDMRSQTICIPLIYRNMKMWIVWPRCKLTLDFRIHTRYRSHKKRVQSESYGYILVKNSKKYKISLIISKREDKEKLFISMVYCHLTTIDNKS